MGTAKERRRVGRRTAGRRMPPGRHGFAGQNRNLPRKKEGGGIRPWLRSSESKGSKLYFSGMMGWVLTGVMLLFERDLFYGREDLQGGVYRFYHYSLQL